MDCKVCFASFDAEKRLPRILNCGHTFCTECISNLLESLKSCPSCRMKISNTDEKEFPINYIILELQNSKSELFHSREKLLGEFLNSLLDLQGDFAELKATLTSERGKIDSNLSLITDCEEKLESLIEVSSDSFDEKSREEVKELEERLSTIRNETLATSSLLPSDVAMLSCNYESTEDYLSEIYRGILSDKRFGAIARVNGVTKCAKLSVRDEYLFIHAFEECSNNKELECTTVCYKDLLGKLLKNTHSSTAANNKKDSPTNGALPLSQISCWRSICS